MKYLKKFNEKVRADYEQDDNRVFGDDLDRVVWFVRDNEDDVLELIEHWETSHGREFNLSEYYKWIDNTTGKMDEGIIPDIFKSKERIEKEKKEERQKALNSIMEHKAKKEIYLKLDDEKKEKYIDAIIEHPGVNYFKWDEAKKKYVPSGKFSVASGEGLAGK